MKKNIKIYTIGHSNRSLKEFIDLFKTYKIETLVDVRRWPKSTKFSHFNREVLEHELEKAGVKYVWLGDLLGGYRPGGYEKYMETLQYKRGLELLEKIAGKKTAAIMCSEKLWFKCHRRFISNSLVEKGYRVIHIIDKKRTQEHKLRKN